MTDPTDPQPMDDAGSDVCPQTRRDDQGHAWHFDGDDPYIVCAWCGEHRDALTGRVIGAMPDDSIEPPPTKPMTDGRLEELRSIADVWPGSKFGVETVDELLAEVDYQRAEIAIWQGIGAKVRGEYRAIPQHGGGVAWLRASDFGVDAVPLTDDEVRLIYGEIDV